MKDGDIDMNLQMQDQASLCIFIFVETHDAKLQGITECLYPLLCVFEQGRENLGCNSLNDNCFEMMRLDLCNRQFRVNWQRRFNNAGACVFGWGHPCSHASRWT